MFKNTFNHFQYDSKFSLIPFLLVPLILILHAEMSDKMILVENLNRS